MIAVPLHSTITETATCSHCSRQITRTRHNTPWYHVGIGTESCPREREPVGRFSLLNATDRSPFPSVPDEHWAEVRAAAATSRCLGSIAGVVTVGDVRYRVGRTSVPDLWDVETF